ncbi:MAG: DUF167 domain-containing protein [Candidatus Magasanikbacteria bacterium]|nr:DUF167 domain-containing protein [Candidatus Magasanikbacteria bacterium]
MKISVRVIPRAKQNLVEVQPDGSYRVRVTTAPTDGKATIAVIKLLAKFFKCSQSEISLVSGATSRNKIFEIL